MGYFISKKKLNERQEEPDNTYTFINMKPFRFIFTLHFALVITTNVFAQSGFKDAKEFKIYTDPACGYGCRMVYDPAFRTCTVNNKPIKCEYVKTTIESKEKLFNFFGKDTAFVKIYNLSGVLQESFYTTYAFVEMDTIGEYCLYYPNGTIKTKGNFANFSSNEKGDVKYELPMSFRHGAWTEFDEKGKVIRKTKYKRGKILN
mgnify:CR=1 FL=1